MYPPPLSSSRGEGVIMSWYCIFIPHNIWWGDDYIVTYFYSPQYLVGRWLYRDVTFSLLTTFGEGGDRNIIFSFLTIFGEGVIITWHYIFPPDNIWWWGDYILTLYFQSWQYLVRGWLYRDIIFSLLTIFGEGVIISWLYIFIPDASPRIWHWRWLYLNIFTIQIWLCSDTRVLLFIYIYSPLKLRGWSDYI